LSADWQTVLLSAFSFVTSAALPNNNQYCM